MRTILFSIFLLTVFLCSCMQRSNRDNVLWNYSGALTATFKNGEKATYDPFAMTMLFKKINDKWKVVFLQESTQEPSDTTKH